jgi:tRNA(Arg) A34 adenosine deaminase TadA
MNDSIAFINRLLDVIEHDIVPRTRTAVVTGNKVFGAAILRKEDASIVIAETNNEMENPLWHGEIHALKKFYEIPAAERPATKDCLFIATHEPCSLCLSAITWTGFDNFYYLFGYTDTADSFNIPHDLRILDEVFKVHDGAYARENHYWKSHGIPDLIAALPAADQGPLSNRIASLHDIYGALSDIYQDTKDGSDIPLA